MYHSVKYGFVAASCVFYASPGLARLSTRAPSGLNQSQSLYLDPSAVNNSLLNFPGASVIGYGINIFQIQPFDASTIQHALQTDHRLIRLKAEAGEFDPGSGEPWSIPTNVACDKLSAKAQSNFDHYDSGLEAEAALSMGGGASGSYQVVTGDASVNAGLSTSFNKDYQYGLYEWKDKSISCGIEEWGEHVDIEYVSKRIGRLPRWKDGDHAVGDAYRDFFSLHGTHIVTNINLGSELSVSTWATNRDFEINANFTNDVKAKFNAVEAQGSVDSHVKADAQYRKFEAALGSATICRGGDEGIAAYISENPEADDVADKLVSWIGTTSTSPIMIGVEIRSIAAVISDFDDPNMRSYAKDLENAYLYIVNHPKVHRTKVRMVINSDWGEVELLSPSAFIEEDSDFAKEKPAGFQMSSTKVAWYGSKPQRDETIDFIIRNDGNPVDLHLGHGLDGPSGSRTGKLEVTIEGQSARPLIYGQDGKSRFDQVKMNPVGVEIPAPELQALISVAPDGTVLTGNSFVGSGPGGLVAGNATNGGDSTNAVGTHWVGGNTPGGGQVGQNYTTGDSIDKTPVQGSSPRPLAGSTVGTGTSGTVRPLGSQDADPSAQSFATSKKQRRRRHIKDALEAASLAY